MNPEEQLDEFLAKFTPSVEALARQALNRMRARIPGAVELVYDSYNSLAIGFSANEKLSGTVFSVAVYPRWVSLFFVRGPELPDPKGLLAGVGNTVRHLILTEIDLFDSPDVDQLIEEGLSRAQPPIDPTQPSKLIIKSISLKQRPRRPKS